MARYALVGPENKICRFAENIDPTAQTKIGYKWLPVESAAQSTPAETQTVVGPTYSIKPDKVVESYSLNNLTQSEIDASKTARIEGLDPLLLKLAFNHENRIRAIESKQPLALDKFKEALRAML